MRRRSSFDSDGSSGSPVNMMGRPAVQRRKHRNQEASGTCMLLAVPLPLEQRL